MAVGTQPQMSLSQQQLITQPPLSTAPAQQAHTTLKPAQQQMPQQQQLGGLRHNSSAFGDLLNSSNRPGSGVKQQTAVPAAATYKQSSLPLGKALGQELEGRRVLEAVEAMQVCAVKRRKNECIMNE